MDSLTQVVLGVAVCQATIGQKINKRALLYGAVIATIPDFDVLIGQWFYDPISAIEIHRGFSHSILFYLLISLILARWISWREKGKVSYQQAYIVSFLILLTHSLLDIFTTWGTQLFWPLGTKLAIKSIFVIDPLYTIPLLIGVAISLWSRNKKRGLKYNYIGLFLSTLYLFLTVGLQQFVKQKVLHDGRFDVVNTQKITVKPTAFNTVLWQVIVEGKDNFYLSDYSFFDTQVATITAYPKNHHLIKNIDNELVVKQLKRISENQFVITNDGKHLYFNDLRFGFLNKNPENPQFAFSYRITQNDGVVKANEVKKDRKDGKKLLKQMIKRMQGEFPIMNN